MNLYPVDSTIGFPNIYPLDSDLFGGYHYQFLEKPGPSDKNKLERFRRTFFNVPLQGSYPFLNKKFKNFSRTFKDTFPIFQGRHSVQKKSLESMSFLVLPQHE